MRNLKLTLSFLGTAYHGYQVQQNAVTVAGTLQSAITAVTGERVELKGCSRTDSGVHARAYVCSFRTASSIPCQKLPLALNSHLPPDIGVLSCEEAPPDFHARYSAKGKEYQYDIYNSPLRNPFYEETAWRFAPRLDEGKLNAWAGEFLGRQDFSAFRAAGGADIDPVRTLTRFTVTRRESLVRFQVEGDGFLYHMVRILVGTLLDLHQHKLPDESPRPILLSRNRARAGFTAPAKGLTLNRVVY